MAGSRAAIRYAKAILDIAQGNNNSEKVLADMNTIVSAVKESKELKLFLESPIVNVQTKRNALVEVFASAQPETKALFQLLLENKRFGILAPIGDQYQELYNEANGIENAVVTTAVPLDAALENKVLAKIATFTSKKVNLTNVVDPAIIGGFVLRIGDQQYNASVANRLLQLKREFSN
ncbi:ATP synthase F1 subunit delta [Flavobacterium sp. NRK F10]|uniref:ATP synthase F1 subunit delta n=1 Tax=Flavobacterium sp. NRK F10 TaxID=2954931 RepID=UPI002090F3B6|nr:ATP synthase F1 subunit delta [Flavobacterium sp. NRK F10]MCO6174935.1 ATP synthase F1 subunit delta [Flavobacterium sp. NRK F10]